MRAPGGSRAGFRRWPVQRRRGSEKFLFRTFQIPAAPDTAGRGRARVGRTPITMAGGSRFAPGAEVLSGDLSGCQALSGAVRCLNPTVLCRSR
jgi:hypothetical protein